MTDVFGTPKIEISSDVERVDVVVGGGSAYDALVGDGKKFKTNEDLAKSAIEKDRFISQLQREAAGRQAELDRIVKETNIDARLNEIVTKLSQAPVAREEGNQPPQPAAQAVTAPDIEAMVRKTIEEDRSRSLAQQNADTVVRALTAAYGSSYSVHLERRTQELGLTKEQMNSLAASSPQAFLELVKVPAPTHSPAPPQSDVNSTSFMSQVSTGKTYSDYQKMMTSPDPKVRAQYWDPKTQMEIHKLGEKALEEGDPYRFFK